MTNLQPQTEQGNTAGEMLAGWAVTVDRDTLTALLTSQNFPALLALCAVVSWRDRGRSWGAEVDGKWVKSSVERPPGGWGHLSGCSAPTWRARLARAVKLGLVEHVTGNVKGRRPVHLLRTDYRKGPGQFARLPISVMTDPGLSRRAKRTYASISAFRRTDKKGGGVAWACPAVETITRMAGYPAGSRSIVQRGLRELVKAGALVDPAPGHATTRARRYLMPADYKPAAKVKETVPPPKLKETVAPPKRNGGPKLKETMAPPERNGGPKLKETVAPPERNGGPLTESSSPNQESSSSARARPDAPFEGAPITPAEPSGLQQDEDGAPPPLRLRTFGVTSAPKPKPRSCAGLTMREMDEAIAEYETLLADLSVEAPSLTAPLEELKAERADRALEKVAA